MNYPLIPILSLSVLIFCVVQLILVTRVCSLCKFLIINELLRAKSTTITDGNRKVVTPTELAVGFIDHFPLLPLKFVIWSLRGLVAGESHRSTVNPVAVLDLCFYRCSCQRCSCSNTARPPVVLWACSYLLEFKHKTALQSSYTTSSYQVAGSIPHIWIPLPGGLCGVSDSHRVNLVINLCFRAAFLSVEGVSEPQSGHRHPVTQWTMAGVLMLITAYKLFSYRNEMNQTWAAPYHVYSCWKLSLFILLRVAMLARDSIVYYIIIFGLCVLASRDYWC